MPPTSQFQYWISRLIESCVGMCVSLQVEVIKKAYLQGEVEFEDTKEEDDNGEEEDHDAASPRNVGHNIYILAHQVQYSATQYNILLFPPA